VSERLISLGQLVATHGIEGWLKLKAYNPQSRVLLSPRKIVLDRDGVLSPHFLEKCRPLKRHFLVKLQGTDEIDTAKRFVHSVLSVEEDSLQSLGPGEYYYYQVVGLDVYDTSGSRIGKVTRIWLKEGGDLYVVIGAAKEYLIPANKEVIEQIDLAAGKMVIDPPDGLLDL
jgi:16S rRNA processing protein RimM